LKKEIKHATCKILVLIECIFKFYFIGLFTFSTENEEEIQNTYFINQSRIKIKIIKFKEKFQKMFRFKLRLYFFFIKNNYYLTSSYVNLAFFIQE
jgi:hypothetical protein